MPELLQQPVHDFIVETKAVDQMVKAMGNKLSDGSPIMEPGRSDNVERDHVAALAMKSEYAEGLVHAELIRDNARPFQPKGALTNADGSPRPYMPTPGDGSTRLTGPQRQEHGYDGGNHFRKAPQVRSKSTRCL